MSASEKLRRLDAWFGDEANYGESWAEASAELVVALPALIAVVEAAEQAAVDPAESSQMYETTVRRWMRDVVAALDEALGEK